MRHAMANNPETDVSPGHSGCGNFLGAHAEIAMMRPAASGDMTCIPSLESLAGDPSYSTIHYYQIERQSYD